MEEVVPSQNTAPIPLESSIVLREDEAQAQEMEPHPLSKVFPAQSDEEFEALCKKIEELGLLEPITVHEGKILDGCHRYKACLLVGVSPRYENFKGDDPVAFIISKNITRRHLKPSQRALIADELEEFGHGGDRRDANLHLVTRSKAARAMGVSTRSVASAHNIKQNGSPELIEAVRRGDITVSKAEAQIKKAASGGMAQATDASDKVTGEQTKTKGKPSKRGPCVTEEHRKAALELTDRLVAVCPTGERAELTELAEKAAPYYGQMCSDLASRLREAAEVDQQ